MIMVTLIGNGEAMFQSVLEKVNLNHNVKSEVMSSVISNVELRVWSRALMVRSQVHQGIEPC